MCMQVAAIKIFHQQSILLPLLIIVPLAPGCPVDDVSTDEHLPIHTIGRQTVSVTLRTLGAFLYSMRLCQLLFTITS